MMAGEIKILGAGIAGLTASINLAKAGFDVTVFERSQTVGRRFHNDLQGLENWSDETDALEILKNLSLKTDFWNRGFKEATIYTDLQKEFIARDADNLCYLVQRGPIDSLDESLKNQALDAGVKIIFNAKADRKECDIIATGVSGKRSVGLVKGIVFDTDLEDSAILLLNDKFAFKGYSYLLVADGRATMASVVIRDLSKSNLCFKNTLEAFSKLEKNFKIENKRSFAGYGTFAVNDSHRQDQRLFVGEAAGFQDLFLGFGMKYALLSGYAAAKSIVEQEDYDKICRELFSDKQKASAANRLIYELSGQRGYNHIADRLSNSRSPKSWLKDQYSFSLIKRLIYPFTKFAKI
jgi:flavin-dependent dehydrogenase